MSQSVTDKSVSEGTEKLTNEGLYRSHCGTREGDQSHPAHCHPDTRGGARELRRSLVAQRRGDAQ